MRSAIFPHIFHRNCFVAQFALYTPQRIFDDFGFYLTAVQRTVCFGGTPAFALNPVKSKILRIFGIVEKVQLLKTVERGFHPVCGCRSEEFVVQFTAAIGTPGQQCRSLFHERLVRCGTRVIAVI
jgi:hypothetical protein